ncbi:MAG TPA: ABC transporter permease [Gemmatimonadaceae bacterium]|jgi:putative ABC transport system permease protein
MRELAPRWKKVWRDAMLHKARTLLVVLAIAVGIAGGGTILVAWALVNRATHDGYLASDPAAATLRVDSLDSNVLNIVRHVEGVRLAEARRTVGASILAGGSWQSALLIAIPDFDSVRIGRLRRDVGPWPTTVGEIAIEHSSLSVANVSVGDEVSIAFGKGEAHPLRTTGIMRDVELAPGWMEHVVYAFVTPATLQQLGVSSTLDELRIAVREPAATQDDVRRIAYRVRATLESAGHRVTNIDVPVPGEHVHAAQMDSLLYTQAAFGVLALMVCGFLVVNLIAAMLAGQVREIGVMKTLGAKATDLSRMYLTFATALGALASLIALPISIALGRSYGALKGDLLNFDVAAYGIPWWSVVAQMGVGVIVPVVAAWFPVRRACRVSIADGLREFGADRSADRFADHWSMRIGGIARPVLLSLRNAFRNRQRMTLTLLALSTGGAVFLAATNLRASVVDSIGLLFDAQKYTFSIRLADAHDVDSVEAAVRQISGVTRVEGWAGLRAVVQHADSIDGNAFTIVAPPPDTKLFAPMLVEGRWLRDADSRAIVVATSLIKLEPSIRLGAQIPLVIDGRVESWTIVGIIDAGPTPRAYTSREIAMAERGARTVTTIAVATNLAGLAMQVDLIQRVRGELDRNQLLVSSSQLVEENRHVLEDHLLMVVQFLSVMGWVMIVVGGMGLASTMSLAVLERTREIGVMRAIGARHGAILSIVQVEGLAIATLSWLVALPLSIPITIALTWAFSRIMLTVPIHFLPATIGVVEWLVLGLVISIVSSAWPALRAVRVSVRDALAFE